MATEFDLAQTFYVDPQAVKMADTIYLTSVDLYFEDKPIAGKTRTGIATPGVTLYVCPVYNDVPDVENYIIDSRARREYSEIITSTTAAIATTFNFEYPVAVKTDRSYAVLIRFDGSDPDFLLWWNKAGEKILSTESTTQVSSGKVDGYFYKLTNGNNLQGMRDADLKFNVKMARFTSPSTTFRLANKDFEFFKYFANNASGNFLGGEYVYQNTTPSSGSLTVASDSVVIEGSGTTFLTDYKIGDHIIFTDGTDTNVRHVVSVASDSRLTVDVTPTFSNSAADYLITPIGYVYDFDSTTEHLFLEGSSANSTIKFTAGETVVGVDSRAYAKISEIINFEANYIRAGMNFDTPSGTTVNVHINFANTSYDYDNGTAKNVELGAEVFINDYPAIIASRSNEVINGGGLFTGSKSLEAQIDFISSNPYTSPYIKEENLDLFTYRFEINNTSTGEETSSGAAKSKAVSKKIVLAEGQDAEDLRVYLTAYKPQGTDIEVYAKFLNVADSEPFDDKSWTKLDLASNTNMVSSSFNRADYIELEYKVPTYQPGTAIDGAWTTSMSNNVIVATGVTANAVLVEQDVVRLYDPAFPNNHITAVVATSNASTITLTTAIDNASLVSGGLKLEKVTNPHSAFLNIQNDNIIRYYNNGLSQLDGYKVFATKIVLLANTDFRVPFVSNIRGIAVSA